MHASAAAGLLVAYVAGASYFGLTGGDPTALGAPAARAMVGAWRESAGADALFALGMAATGVASWRLAARGRAWASAGAGLAGAYATFAVSFAFLSWRQHADVVTMAPLGLAMVALAGWMGLAFAAAAPPVAHALVRRRGGARRVTGRGAP